ncbi:hypothetical protein VP1G_10524 [Cytospora mali]|uniref:Uncharacterized protein n=1 Tax=Cytospora mali TaxID=578113 RepID=A0A194UNE3_CYTMA|nr:hypothetical protein VP1G_10524 [Valsa mali var. pyri (nom. inval.)]
MMSPIGWLLAALALSCKAHKAGIARSQNDANTSSVSGLYELSDLYNSTNFFDKFHFNESITGTAEYTDVDKTSGFVLYQSQAEAERLGLIQTRGTFSDQGRSQIGDIRPYRLRKKECEDTESRDVQPRPLHRRLFTPPSTAMWSMASLWNIYNFNRQTLHTTYNTTVGKCTFNTTSTLGLNDYDMTNYIYSDVCDVYASDNVGCSSWDYEGPYGSAEGGVYALEWTSEYIKMWTWHPEQVPSDSIVFNIDLCGVTAGDGSEWASECAEKTGYNTCQRYVAANPGAFEEA